MGAALVPNVNDVVVLGAAAVAAVVVIDVAVKIDLINYLCINNIIVIKNKNVPVGIPKVNVVGV